MFLGGWRVKAPKGFAASLLVSGAFAGGRVGSRVLIKANRSWGRSGPYSLTFSMTCCAKALYATRSCSLRRLLASVPLCVSLDALVRMRASNSTAISTRFLLPTWLWSPEPASESPVLPPPPIPRTSASIFRHISWSTFAGKSFARASIKASQVVCLRASLYWRGGLVGSGLAGLGLWWGRGGLIWEGGGRRGGRIMGFI